MITQVMCASFLSELLTGVHNFSTDTFKLALYSPSATLNGSTTVYSPTNEVASMNYAPGGAVVTVTTIGTDPSGIAFVNFSTPTWTGVSFTTRGALLYNTSKSNKAVAVIDFGVDKTFSNATVRVRMPDSTASTALVRLTN